MLIDFSVRVGRENVLKRSVRNESLHGGNNDNRMGLLHITTPDFVIPGS